jgi:hypothetical protein
MKETPTVAAAEGTRPPLPAYTYSASGIPSDEKQPETALRPGPIGPEPEAAPVDKTLQLTPEPPQETDAWWGSYSGWTMMPSTVVCLVLTALIAWGAWRLLDKGWVQLSVLTLAGGLWLAQAFRWCYRVFGYNYRLTTRRLVQTRGILYDAVEVDLAAVTKVEARRSPADWLVGVGNVCITLEDPLGTKVILEGVSHPGQVADHVRKLCEQAREQRVMATKI